MRISPVRMQSTKAPSFGRITRGAVDSFRNNVEGYKVENDGWLQIKQTAYNADSQYNLMSEEEIKKLGELVDRASKLKKTIITALVGKRGGRSCEFWGGLCVDPVRSGYINVQFNPDNKGDFEASLEKFEEALEYAQEIEDDPEARAWERKGSEIDGFGTVYVQPAIDNDRFKTKKELEMLNEIYAKTVNTRCGGYLIFDCVSE